MAFPNPFSSSTKTTSSGTSAFDTTKKRTNPAWVDELASGFGGEISGLGKIDPNSLVPGANPLQTKAADSAFNIGPLAEAYGGALDLTGGIAHANAPRTEFVGSSGFIDDFMNPYLKDVVDTSAADFDFNAGNVRGQQDLDLAGSGAFGGSGAALTKSMTEGELARGRGSLLSGLRSGGYDRALSAAQTEAARKQSANDFNAGLYGQQMDRALGAGGQIADIAGAFGGERRADIATQAGIGSLQRDIDRETANAVPDWLARREELFAGLPLDLFGGEDISGTTTSKSKSKSKNTPSLMDSAGTALQIAALFAGSDRRIKRDIVPLYRRPDGLWVYLFRYIWGPALHIGVMAQEVLKVKPQAVARHPRGYLMVDYSQI